MYALMPTLARESGVTPRSSLKPACQPAKTQSAEALTRDSWLSTESEIVSTFW